MIDINEDPLKEKEPELKDGTQQPIFLDQIVGLFQTVSTAPTVSPRFVKDQIQIYTSGSTFRFYWWDNTNKTWHYVTATA